jgi:hypothetical protein
VAAGETYAHDRNVDEAEGRQMWMVPEAFNHPAHGYVGLLIMHRFL